jgi:anti-sigma factor RsiW
MSVSDEELELLDRYLDGDLGEAEAVGLEARLHADAELSAELAKLREYRGLRAEAFAALEPSDVESQQLNWFVRGALHQQARQDQRRDGGAGRSAGLAFPVVASWTRTLSRIAAVLLVGIGIGYAVRGPSVGPKGPVAGSGGVAARTPVPGGIDLTSDGPPVFVSEAQRTVAGFAGPNGAVTTVARPVQPAAGGYQVALTDQDGRVVAVQQFRSLQEAREFTADLQKWQQRYRQVQNSGVRLVGDDF